MFIRGIFSHHTLDDLLYFRSQCYPRHLIHWKLIFTSKLFRFINFGKTFYFKNAWFKFIDQILKILNLIKFKISKIINL